MTSALNNLVPMSKSVHFGFDLSDDVEAHLQAAAASVSNDQDSLAALNRAYKSAPDQLEVLVALYKFHFYRGDTNKAQEIVQQTLVKAAFKGGFEYDWTKLSDNSADWSDHRGPARTYLYSLKAMAFINLRRYCTDEAREILDKLQQLDPDDQVGAQVIRELLSAVEQEAVDE